jgi:hypothetical protein
VIGPQKSAHVRRALVPDELVAEIPPETEWQNFFLLWAQFTDHEGHLWKALHNAAAQTRRDTYELQRS